MSNEYGLFRRHRLLTGARLETARKAFWQDCFLAVIAVALAFMLVGMWPEEQGVIFFVLLVLALLWTMFRFFRKETILQLRIQEVKSGKKESTNALKELEEFAEDLKEKHGKDE